MYGPYTSRIFFLDEQTFYIYGRNLNNKLRKNKTPNLAMIWWCLWHQRNKILFEQTTVLNDIELDTAIKNQLKNWESTKKLENMWKATQKGKRNEEKRKTKNRIVRWTHLATNTLKVNFDHSARIDGSTSTWCVIRNSEGVILHIVAEVGSTLLLS